MQRIGFYKLKKTGFFDILQIWHLYVKIAKFP